MEKYNYLEAVTADAKQWLLDNYEIKDIINAKETDTFYDEMWMNDSVTGNASGSYTYNAWKASEYLCHNWDLIEEANNEMIGLEHPYISSGYEYGAEYWDVIIRCYLLSNAIAEAINEIMEENE